MEASAIASVANTTVAQSQTLYINNLNEKIKKDVLKKILYMIFSQYGKVIEIIACKGLKLRGQAWVVYDNVNSAINAMRGKQNFNVYGKPMVSTSSNSLALIINFVLL